MCRKKIESFKCNILFLIFRWNIRITQVLNHRLQMKKMHKATINVYLAHDRALNPGHGHYHPVPDHPVPDLVQSQNHDQVHQILVHVLAPVLDLVLPQLMRLKIRRSEAYHILQNVVELKVLQKINI